MSAITIEYADYDENAPLTCPDCGWRGTGKTGWPEYYHGLFDVSCPGCQKMLLIVPYPRSDDTPLNDNTEHTMKHAGKPGYFDYDGRLARREIDDDNGEVWNGHSWQDLHGAAIASEGVRISHAEAVKLARASGVPGELEPLGPEL